jgi:prevent-host-death family protein
MYTVHKTKTYLSKLLRKVEKGEEVIIARGKKPVAKIVSLDGDKPKKRIPGRWKGKLSYADDAFAPLTNAELKELGFE